MNIFEFAKKKEKIAKLNNIFSYVGVHLYVRHIKEIDINSKTYKVSDFETFDDLKIFFYENIRKIRKVISENINFIDTYYFGSGKLHNKYGPAYTRTSKNTEIIMTKLFFKRGKPCQEKDVLKKSRDSKLDRVFGFFGI